MIRSCTLCSNQFDISEADLAFYDKVSPTFAGQKFSIPPPTLCPSCRNQRRISFRNERTLYKRRCDLTGQSSLSMYAPGTTLTNYCKEAWYSDRWDALRYGREFDFTRPFFEQFAELNNAVPQLALNHQTENQNCDFTNLVSRNKDCFYIFAGNDNEGCFYSTYIQGCRDVADSFFIFKSEQCYECIDCYNCYNLQYSQYSSGTSDSYFLIDCRESKNCFGCVSLVNKQYCFFNQQLSRNEYEQRTREFMSNAGWIERARQEVNALKLRSPQKAYAGINNTGLISGDHISYCKNTEQCFDVTYLEDCKYCTWLHKGRDCYDCYAWGLSAELGLENHLCGNNYYHCLFCESCGGDISSLLYCRSCVNGCKHLFGCVGLRGKQHCVLNLEYSVSEYESLVTKIIKHMQSTGEWGEFFPTRISPFAYNETVAQEYFPLTPAKVKERGWRWKDDLPGTRGAPSMAWQDLPNAISEVPESICDNVLACTACQRNYRLTRPELKFYKKLELSIPKLCFDCRYQARRNMRNPRTLWERHCEKCAQQLLSSYDPALSQIVYCEGCYLEQLY
jgi:hypothetical protein